MNLKRIRDFVSVPGRFLPGMRNAITDVPGVSCAHVTVGDTGLTLISPCDGDVFGRPLPAAVAVGNGFGKLVGALQIMEMGVLESFIGLTNTLSVAAVLQGLVDYHAPKLPPATTINIVVGETNDGKINDIHACHIKSEHVGRAISLLGADVGEGAVGAGAGTVCFGYKGGIGTSSRIVPGDINKEGVDYTVGALVQSNYGGNLTLYGQRIAPPVNHDPADGSCMIVILTDAPLSSRQLTRLGKRALIGMTNTGSYMGNGSGDFAIAASNYDDNRRPRAPISHTYRHLSDAQLNPFFEACADATQEALYNSMTMARGTERYPGLGDILASFQGN